MIKTYNINHTTSVRNKRIKTYKPELYDAFEIVRKMKNHGIYDKVVNLINAIETRKYLNACIDLERQFMEDENEKMLLEL